MKKTEPKESRQKKESSNNPELKDSSIKSSQLTKNESSSKSPQLIPKNLNEEEVLATIEKVVNILAAKFRFGYYDIDDIKQEGRIIGLKSLTKYDSTRPLDGYLYTSIRNRLINFKRNKYVRIEWPCKNCPFYDPDCKQSENKCAVFKDKMECDRWAGWKKRNDTKQNIVNPIDIGGVNDEGESNMRIDDYVPNFVDKKELFEYFEENLDLNYRADYLRLLNGVSVPKVRREPLLEELRRLASEKVKRG